MSRIRELTRKTIEEKGYTLKDVARAINYGASTFSQYMSGTYPAAAGRIEAALLTWLRREGTDLKAGDASDTATIETKTTAVVVDACNAALEEGIMAAVIGPPGVGKTFGIRAWEDSARREGLRFIVLAANVLTSAVSLVRDIAAALGVEGRTAAQLIAGVTEKLRREPSVLIIDEAQHLNVRSLETVRAIHDATMTGVVFVGSLALSRTLDEGDATSAELAQLQDRIAIIERVSAMSPLEVMRFVRRATGLDVIDPAAMEVIREVSRGIPRRLVRLMSHTRKLAEGSQKPITAALVRAAAQRLVAA